MTNAVSSISSCSLNIHINKPHDSSHTGEKEAICTYSSFGTGQFSDILQCDGADTRSESSFNDNNSNAQGVGNVARPAAQSLPSVNRVVPTTTTNQRVNMSSELPVIAVANARSFLPKLKSTVEKFQNEGLSILLISEIWEKTGKNNLYFQARMEEVLQMDELKYISCGSRSSGNRGGGAAILIDTRKYSIENLDINIPHNLEVQWTIVRPKELSQNSKFKEYIVCSFYSPRQQEEEAAGLPHLHHQRRLHGRGSPRSPACAAPPHSAKICPNGYTQYSRQQNHRCAPHELQQLLRCVRGHSSSIA